jgi:hypothetical protein
MDESVIGTLSGEYKLIAWGIKYNVLLPSYIAFQVPPFSYHPRGSCSPD